ncbi:MAG TPA: hypothetical protein ENN30_02840 [Candidatus Woesearchaeota archaeon]|nr:hypothetical protein [Candidatus Woesearchaeota archaeon]
MKKIALLLSLLMLIPFAVSVGVSPPSKEYVFEPKMAGEVQFYFRNNLDHPTKIVASISGELAQYAKIKSNPEMILNSQEKGYVDITFSLPEYIGEPGWHSFTVVATEMSDTGGTVGARGQIKVPVTFFVRYPGQKVDFKIDASDGQAGDDIKFKLDVSNVGIEPVENAQATISIFKGYEKIGEVLSESFHVGLMEKKNIDLYWNSGNNVQGEYFASGILKYDSKEEYANDSFRIGEFDLDVINHTEVVSSGVLNDFFIEVESKWNQKIENIFIDAKVLKNGNVAAEFSLAEKSLEPWQKKNIKGFLDARDIENGRYNLTMELRFSSQGVTKSKSAFGLIEVAEKSVETAIEERGQEIMLNGIIEKYATATNMLILLVALLIIINIIIFIRKKKNEKIGKEGNISI